MQAKLVAIALMVLLVLPASCTGGGDEPDGVATGGGCRQTLVVYLHVSATPARQDRVGRLLEERDDVDSLTYHSPQEAYEAFKDAYRGQPEVYKDRGPKDFPGSYEVTLAAGVDYGEFEAGLVGTPGIDKLVPGGCAQGAGS